MFLDPIPNARLDRVESYEGAPLKGWNFDDGWYLRRRCRRCLQFLQQLAILRLLISFFLPLSLSGDRCRALSCHFARRWRRWKPWLVTQRSRMAGEMRYTAAVAGGRGGGRGLPSCGPSVQSHAWRMGNVIRTRKHILLRGCWEM